MSGPNRFTFKGWVDHITAMMDATAQRVDTAVFESQAREYSVDKGLSDGVAGWMDVASCWTYPLNRMAVRYPAVRIEITAGTASATGATGIAHPGPGVVAPTVLTPIDKVGAPIPVGDVTPVLTSDRRTLFVTLNNLAGIPANKSYEGRVTVGGNKVADVILVCKAP